MHTLSTVIVHHQTYQQIFARLFHEYILNRLRHSPPIAPDYSLPGGQLGSPPIFTLEPRQWL